MKKYFALPFFLILAIPSHSEEFGITDLSGGMYTNATENKIPDNTASVIQNFNSDIEPILVERNGYVRRDSTALGGTADVTGLWPFVDSTGSEWIISFSSKTFYKNLIGQTPTAFGLSPTATTIPDATTNLGKIWFVNGTDDMWWFDGVDTGTVASAPIGRLIDSWRNRIVIANITGAQSTVRFSEDGDGENWALGGNPTDPFSIQIGGANDGQYVRCLRGSYLDSLIFGRKYDLWALDGFDQGDVVLRNISTQIGCIEPNSMQEVDGALIFLSARGVEEMRGRQITPISEPIRNITDIIVKNSISQRSNSQTSQADFAAGTMDNSVYLDTHTAPGSVQLTFPEPFDSLRNGESSTKDVWVSSRGFTSPPLMSTVTVSSGKLSLTQEGGTTVGSYLSTKYPFNSYQQGTTFYVTISSLPFYSGNFERFALVFSSRNFITLAGDPATASSNFTFLWVSTESGSATLFSVSNDKGDTGLTVSTSANIPFSFGVNLSTTGLNYYVNNILIKSGSHTWDNRPIYAALQYEHGGNCTRGVNCTDATLLLDDFTVTPQTATFTSQLISIGNSISSWGPVTISDAKTNGNISYTFGSTSAASISAISNYTSIVNGAAPTVSTNPYAAFKAVFSNSVGSSTVKLDEFLTTWNEGSVIPSPVSAVYDRRYWLSFTTQTVSDPSQDTVFVWQRTKSWVMFKGINAASFTSPLWRDALYFGNSNSTGYVYKFDVGNNDDGADISSLLVTKSYDLLQPFREKEFMRTYVNYNADSLFSGNFSFGYNLDRYGTTYSMGTASLSEGQGLASIKFPFGLSNIVRGRELQFNLTKSGTGDRLRVGGISTQYQLKEER